MIVPEFWAESRRQHRSASKQVTVRRFGWSDDSQAAAQRHADQRAEEALWQALRDPSIRRRDPKVPYNGADGLPIREEVITRHPRYVITRNSYGALCINTPDVLFADIDFRLPPFYLLPAFMLATLIATCIGTITGSWSAGISLSVLGFIGWSVVRSNFLDRYLESDAIRQSTLASIENFVEQSRSWSLRIYETPAGFRLIATHRTFDPHEADVAELFQALQADPVYVRMCHRQNCFRARLTAKPWRIGISSHMRPRPGVWPIAPERKPQRDQWIADYQAAATQYAACRYLKSIGPSVAVAPEVQVVVDIHDQLSSANSNLPIA